MNKEKRTKKESSFAHKCARFGLYRGALRAQLAAIIMNAGHHPDQLLTHECPIPSPISWKHHECRNTAPPFFSSPPSEPKNHLPRLALKKCFLKMLFSFDAF